jgi:hypothetical protein
MIRDWQQLTAFCGDEAPVIERVRLPVQGIAIEGSFELPPLAKLAAEDQVFVAAFVRAHGSIKRMEELFGISYPTIKNRLRRLSKQLSFLDPQVLVAAAPRPSPGGIGSLLDALERGELSGREAIDRLNHGGADRPQAEGDEA